MRSTNAVSLAAFLTLTIAGSAPACIQTMRLLPPRDPAQLPADLFKLHIDIQLPPLTIDLPLLGGSTPVALTHEKRDPQADFSALIREFEAAPQNRTFAERTDYAAALLFAGRAADAIPVLQALEHDLPGQYTTASNLGTAYELVGDLEKAKHWIAQGIARNPESHVGTEWLHLAILEAKEKLRSEPHWLVKHSVLDGVKNRTRSEIARALEYQLNERLYFIRRDDPVMCDLMYQAAVATDDAAKRAYFLKQAPRFGHIRDSEIRKLTQG